MFHVVLETHDNIGFLAFLHLVQHFIEREMHDVMMVQLIRGDEFAEVQPQQYKRLPTETCHRKFFAVGRQNGRCAGKPQESRWVL